MNWKDFIEQEKNKDYFKILMDKVNNAYNSTICFPPYDAIFRAFELTPLDEVKCVILGQDPYHEKGQANGLAFSSSRYPLPPSLKNIYKEMEQDLGLKVKQDGDLTYLAKEGVLLLNACLSVEEGKANSHVKFGWNIFTDNVIKLLNTLDKPLVFILWGNFAIKKTMYLNNKKHKIITSVHPSPLSANRGFFGSKPFSKTNEYLIMNNIKPIKWVKDEVDYEN